MKGDELLIGASVAALAGVAFWQRRTIVDVISRGTRLTRTVLGPDGVVPERPEDLAAAAAVIAGRLVPQELYDLARMVRSEGAGEGGLRAHVALNDAASHNWTIHWMLTYSTNLAARGRYGEQFTPADRAPRVDGQRVKSVRRYSTARDPYAGDLQIVERTLRERAQGRDPTEGAVKFLDRSALAHQEGAGSYEDIVRRWGESGLRPFNVPGYSDDFVVFRRA